MSNRSWSSRRARRHAPRPVATAGLATLLFLPVAGTSSDSARVALEVPAEVRSRFGIRTETAAPAPIERSVELVGEIVHDVDRIVHVRPRFAGVIESHRHHIGDWVDGGDVLVTIESNEGLASYPVEAPIPGILIDGHAHPGEAIETGQELYTISDTRKVWVELRVFPDDLPAVAVGQTVELEVPGVERSFTGSISFVDPTVDPRTRAAIARIVMDNPDGVLRPGLFVSGRAVVDRTQAAVAIPASALLREPEGWVVFVAAGADTFEKRPVVLGARGRGRIEIRSGLEAGANVVVEGAFLLDSATRIEPGGGHGH